MGNCCSRRDAAMTAAPPVGHHRTMKIVIAGGHGKIALLLSQQLHADGHEVVGIIRDPAQSDDLADVGATGLVFDLEASSAADLAAHLDGTDAVVFAAGAGPGSGPERKKTVDHGACVLLADAAEQAGVPRIVVVSAMGIDDHDASSDDGWEVYKTAKAEADAYVRGTGLDWTIVRPGGLTDDVGSGTVTIGDMVERGSIPRADVAAVIAELLTSGRGVHTQFEVVSGDTPISALDPAAHVAARS